MAEVLRLKALTDKLQRLAKAAGENPPTVYVGYTQAYAVYVHENLEARHPVGQAKFLEQPARLMSDSGELARIVDQGLKRGATLSQALLGAGLRLQRESQLLCPVDTGALRASAFTRLEGADPGSGPSGEEAGGEGG